MASDCHHYICRHGVSAGSSCSVGLAVPQAEARTEIVATANPEIKVSTWQGMALILHIFLTESLPVSEACCSPCLGESLCFQIVHPHKNKILCRTAPGIINEKLCAKYDLIHREVTLVMTDIQGSTELWDWYEQLHAQSHISHLICLHARFVEICSFLQAHPNRLSCGMRHKKARQGSRRM